MQEEEEEGNSWQCQCLALECITALLSAPGLRPISQSAPKLSSSSSLSSSPSSSKEFAYFGPKTHCTKSFYDNGRRITGQLQQMYCVCYLGACKRGALPTIDRKIGRFATHSQCTTVQSKCTNTPIVQYMKAPVHNDLLVYKSNCPPFAVQIPLKSI